MRFSKILALTILSLCLCSGAASATVITVHYTGTYTGSWFGNYDPLRLYPPDFLGGPTSGTYAQTPFDLTFTFDSSLAIPGSFTPSHLGNPWINPQDPWFPSLGQATFVSPLFNLGSGAGYSFDDAAVGMTTQTAAFFGFHGVGEVISMTSYSPEISPNILHPVKITSGLTGSGGVQYSYASTGLGGGMAALFLVPQTLEISISPITDAVPEPSTWAMLLIGFAVLGFAAYRQKLKGGMGLCWGI
ncbi:PEPxxWA-CTERM sorting domain-containing protein [Bradyrhizobium sp. RDT10]